MVRGGGEGGGCETCVADRFRSVPMSLLCSARMLCVVVPEFEESLIRITKNFVPPKEWKKPPAEGPFLEEFGLPVSVCVVYLGQCWGHAA